MLLIAISIAEAVYIFNSVLTLGGHHKYNLIALPINYSINNIHFDIAWQPADYFLTQPEPSQFTGKYLNSLWFSAQLRTFLVLNLGMVEVKNPSFPSKIVQLFQFARVF